MIGQGLDDGLDPQNRKEALHPTKPSSGYSLKNKKPKATATIKPQGW